MCPNGFISTYILKQKHNFIPRDFWWSVFAVKLLQPIFYFLLPESAGFSMALLFYVT